MIAQVCGDAQPVWPFFLSHNRFYHGRILVNPPGHNWVKLIRTALVAWHKHCVCKIWQIMWSIGFNEIGVNTGLYLNYNGFHFSIYKFFFFLTPTCRNQHLVASFSFIHITNLLIFVAREDSQQPPRYCRAMWLCWCSACEIGDSTLSEHAVITLQRFRKS